ncbi:hypothetical protein M975_3221 [Buttiauxella brennerae ATCC 51605]|uniref:Uncharacterized protein n=1 Tax=Buttiauxella brennerae ATCC 51605 TaxID=1354251 RepID=A0A1B7IJN2_9ENTR|nr:hypothetical protein M975_3221 [Buttiauxella brennerae ATCC 51605]
MSINAVCVNYGMIACRFNDYSRYNFRGKFFTIERYYFLVIVKSM